MKAHRSATYQRVWFITGSSAGLGRALTEAVLARGERAVVTAPTPERVRDLIERYPAQALVLELDVTRQDQVRRAVAEAIERFGRIDVLVNNAGQLFDSNVFGLVKVVTIEPGNADGHPADDLVAKANDIISIVDADSVESPIR
jgi:NAD(P)-dependent dehydrogenase (short-subunit alcohol dehydrogenase family)